MSVKKIQLPFPRTTVTMVFCASALITAASFVASAAEIDEATRDSVTSQAVPIEAQHSAATKESAEPFVCKRPANPS